MYEETWNKYVKGLKFLLPFILVQVLFEIISFKIFNNIGVDKYNFITEGENLIRNSIGRNIKELITGNLALIIFSLLVEPLFYSFVMIIMKKLITDKDVNYTEDFKVSLSFYLRYLGLTIIIGAILLGTMLLSLFAMVVTFVFFLIIILVIYLAIAVTPCSAYLIYYDTTPEEALSKGMALGKKYFWKILLLSIIMGVLNRFIDVGPNASIIGYVAIAFIRTSVKFYLLMFTMNICKEEEIIEGY
ncbi:hypothetical protein [Clostridium tetanomorphum]|uniref:Uncharacterized protein n=1 Tax=Clostridium tetanomorphum TaxID=1553 RepID=A0A923EAY2_CLOTT|nr:hypothetical protein [Clostridium tetanomorphum]MBC2397023.1 hypothetical protein [Clostridium tetanomorphum]NRZ99135.1 hypothetical protein [Clostridium tetanomorphum]